MSTPDNKNDAKPADKQASLPAGGVKCRVIHGSYKTIVNGTEATLTEGDECTLPVADADIGVEAGALAKL